LSDKKTIKLNKKHKRFVEEYLLDFNGKWAAIRAGYSPKTAQVQSSRLLSYAKVKEYLDLRSNELSNEIKLNQLQTLREIKKIALFDSRKFYKEDGSLKNPIELDDYEAAALAGTETIRRSAGKDDDGNLTFETVDKIKYADKKSALELLAKIQGLLNDRPELTGANGGDININVSIDSDDD
jgi:phage terminase small subunit